MLNRITALLNAAYADMISDNFDHDFVVGCIAEAKALAEGDTGSFDQPEAVKTKTATLTGPALNWAVAKALPLNEEDYVEIDNLYGTVWRGPEYSIDWAQGGPIIERERISVGTEENDWSADITTGSTGFVRGYGPTPLVAAMRCFVASKLGDEIEVPEELK